MGGNLEFKGLSFKSKLKYLNNRFCKYAQAIKRSVLNGLDY